MFRQIAKKILYFILYYSGMAFLLIFILKNLKKQHCAAILFYHRFSFGAPDYNCLPFVDIREFEKQLRHVKRWYNVITMDMLSNKLYVKEDFQNPAIIITIDDGYRDNYTVAYPILRELEMPAMIYLTTGFINTNKVPWVDHLFEILVSTREKNLCFPELLDGSFIDLSSFRKREDAFIKLFHCLLYLDHREKMLAIRKLSEILCVRDSGNNNAERKMLNWHEILEMSRHKITFGAHTVNHPTLSRMEPTEAQREIYESKIAIEEKIGYPVRHFAIPNGKKKDFSEDLKKYCEKLGMTSVVSTESGLVCVRSDPYFLRRISPPAPIYIFVCELARYMFLQRKQFKDIPFAECVRDQ